MLRLTKTLIIFDTNILRLQEENLEHDKFNFGYMYYEIKNFIKQYKLEQHVKLSISSITIGEMIHQRCELYKKDMDNYKALNKKLISVPAFSRNDINIIQGFNYKNFIETECKTFLQNEKVNIIVNDGDNIEMFKNIILRAINKQKPFKGKSPSDAGFKDVLIWEGLLNYNSLNDFDNFILFTKDTGFDESCENEFEFKTSKKIKILSTHGDIISELQILYDNYLPYIKLYEYATSDYFVDTLKNDIQKKTKIRILENECSILDINILIPDLYIYETETVDIEGEGRECICIVSLIYILYKDNDYLRETTIISESDYDDNLGVFNIEYEPLIY